MNTKNPIRWGLLGAGQVAHKFAEGIRSLPDAVVSAVGTRDPKKAAAFAEEHGIPAAHGNLSDLIADPTIDVIYVSTPSGLHHEHCILCLEGGKPILCEKPFAVSQAQAEEVFSLAKKRNLFAMEAMWMRFIPGIVRLEELIAEGHIGDVRMVQASFSFRTRKVAEHRLFNPKLGGGALLDVGIYPLALAQLLLGEPEEVTGVAEIGDSGVDEQCVMSLRYAEGRIATLNAAIRTQVPIEAHVYGTKGRIRLHSAMYRPTRLSVIPQYDPDTETGGFVAAALPLRLARKVRRSLRVLRGREPEGQHFEVPFDSTGYQYQATAVGECLRKGLVECPRMPHSATLSCLNAMDQLRSSWGLSGSTPNS